MHLQNSLFREVVLWMDREERVFGERKTPRKANIQDLHLF